MLPKVFFAIGSSGNVYLCVSMYHPSTSSTWTSSATTSCRHWRSSRWATAGWIRHIQTRSVATSKPWIVCFKSSSQGLSRIWRATTSAEAASQSQVTRCLAVAMVVLWAYSSIGWASPSNRAAPKRKKCSSAPWRASTCGTPTPPRQRGCSRLCRQVFCAPTMETATGPPSSGMSPDSSLPHRSCLKLARTCATSSSLMTSGTTTNSSAYAPWTQIVVSPSIPKRSPATSRPSISPTGRTATRWWFRGMRRPSVPWWPKPPKSTTVGCRCATSHQTVRLFGGGGDLGRGLHQPEVVGSGKHRSRWFPFQYRYSAELDGAQDLGLGLREALRVLPRWYICTTWSSVTRMWPVAWKT